MCFPPICRIPRRVHYSLNNVLSSDTQSATTADGAWHLAIDYWIIALLIHRFDVNAFISSKYCDLVGGGLVWF